MTFPVRIRLFLATLLSACALSFPACYLDDDFGDNFGKGDVVTETRNVKDFRALDVSVPGNVEVRVGSEFRVEVSCEENIISFLETIVDNGTLKIRFDRNVFDVDGLRIRVTAPVWEAFRLRGSADIDVVDAITGNQLELEVTGSGDLKVFNATYERVRSRVTGSSDIKLSGRAKELNTSISGSGNFEALNFPVETAVVAVTGSGDAQVHVLNKLDATISGSGDIRFRGSPQVSSNVSGSGRVRKID